MTEIADLLPDDWESWPSERKRAFLESVKYNWALWRRPSQWPPENDDWTIFLFLAGRASGKLFCKNLPVFTPQGWALLGDLKVGDQVFDEMGRMCNILAVHDDTPDVAYRVNFSDGTYLDASAEHQWVTVTHKWIKNYVRRQGNNRDSYPENWAAQPPITTQQIKDTLDYPVGPNGRRDLNHRIPTTLPLQMPAIDSVFGDDLYIVGFWLGDGSTGCGTFTQDTKNGDKEALIAQIELAGFKSNPDMSCPMTVGTKGLMTKLREESPSLLKSKAIPAKYLLGSYAQRLSLLQGLLDSDGFIDEEKQQVEFCSMRQDHAEFVLDLARSLGQKAVLKTGRALLEGRDYGTKYRVFFPPTIQVFRLERKANKICFGGPQYRRRSTRMITSVEPIDPVPMRCLTVDSPNHMWLAGKQMVPSHNTRSGAEWVRWKANNNPGCRIAVIAPTHSGVRDVCFEGDSGLINITPKGEIAKYNKTLLQITFDNGSKIFGYSSAEPDRLRGPQHHFGWLDEVVAWDNAPEMFAMYELGLRLGKYPQTFVSTTPKPQPLIIDLYNRSQDPDDTVILSTGSIFDNAANLSAAAVAELKRRYEGTSLGRQELYGDLVMDQAGALWTRELIERNRLDGDPFEIRKHMTRVVVAVDPCAGHHEERDSNAKINSSTPVCGIVVMGIDSKGIGYVLADASVVNPTPEQWAAETVRQFHLWQADRIVIERTHGGAMVEHTVRTVWPNAPIKAVHASTGKWARAEPVVALYEQDKIKHVGSFALLEDQMCSYVKPTVGGPKLKYSPDRMDALVWAGSELMLFGGIGELYLPTDISRLKLRH